MFNSFAPVKQSHSRFILYIYPPPSPSVLSSKDEFGNNLKWLAENSLIPEVSEDCKRALSSADVIIFGSGTQHSSLLPSYKILGSRIAQAPARVKCLVVNLYHDHDIQGLDASDIVDNALRYMGDEDNAAKSITHIIYNISSSLPDPVVFSRQILEAGQYKGARIIAGTFANPVMPGYHNGAETVSAILNCLNGADCPGVLSIVINPLNMFHSLKAIFDEASEIDWRGQFSKVNFYFPDCPATREIIERYSSKLPAWLEIHAHDFESGSSFETSVLQWWRENSASGDYLGILNGDGEYDISDLSRACELLEKGNYGLIMGSRVQSRRQFHHSLASAYGERSLLYYLSRLGAFVATSLLCLRFGLIFSDPLTGFRVYSRKNLGQELFSGKLNKQQATFLPNLLKKKIEVAEIPVSYRTFKGFTSARWRWKKGFSYLRDFLR